MRSKVISFVNEKGGVGKTHTTLQTAFVLAAGGARVLIIDNDASGDASTTLAGGVLPEEIAEVFKPKGVSNTINLYTPGMAYKPLPAGERIDYFGAGERLAAVGGDDAIYAFIDSVESLAKEYDYVLIDCPPSIGAQSTAAIRASDAVIIPCNADWYSYKNAMTILTRLKLEQKRQKKAPKVAGIFLNNLKKPHPNSVKDVIEAMRQEFGPLLLQKEDGTPIALSATVRQAEAQSIGMSILDASPLSNAAVEMAELVNEFLIRLENLEKIDNQYQKFSEGRAY